MFPRAEIFCHFLDLYHYENATVHQGYRPDLVEKEARLAFRIAYMCSERISISASAVFESPIASSMILNHAPLFEIGDARIVGKDSSLTGHFYRKQQLHYPESSPIHSAYTRLVPQTSSYESYDIDVSGEVRRYWKSICEKDNIPVWFRNQRSLFPSQVDDLWMSILERVYPRALVTPHILPMLEINGRSTEVIWQDISTMVDRGYVSSHILSLNASLISDLRYLAMGSKESHELKGLSYAGVLRNLWKFGLYDALKNAECERLVSLKWSDAGQQVARLLTGGSSADTLVPVVVDALLPARRKGIFDMHAENSPSIGIIVALPEEDFAVRQCLGARRVGMFSNDPNFYSIATVSSSWGGPYTEVVIASLSRQGTNSAAAATTSLLRSFPSVTDIIFCGIAGGVPNGSNQHDGIHLGDVLVSDRRGVVQYDSVAIRNGNREDRSILPPPSARLLHAVSRLRSDLEGVTCPTKFEWVERLRRFVDENPNYSRPSPSSDIVFDDMGDKIDRACHRIDSNTPYAYYGAIGSSNALLRDHLYREQLRSTVNIIGFEMEGAGTAEAVHHFSKGYLLIRGVCDYGDDRTKNDAWHRYAAAAAACYMKSVLKRVS